MKRIAFFIAVLIAASSCNEEDICPNNETEAKDSYYVRYEIQGAGTYNYFSNWAVTTPQGKYTSSGYQVKSWTQTYGPINKGFKCDAQVYDGNCTIEIYVSRNQEPFALKVTKTGSSSSASYTIDF